LRWTAAGVRLDDWLDGLRGAPPSWLELTPSRLLERGRARADRLLGAWLKTLAAAACAQPCDGWLIGADAVLRLPAPTPAAAREQLDMLLAAWREGQREPLPWALRTALASAAGGDARAAYEGGFGDVPADVAEPCLARVYPDFSALAADGRHAHYAERLFAPLLAWARDAVEVLEHAALGGADD
jgi:exodeoxyribonuclease V gamma subunit